MYCIKIALQKKLLLFYSPSFTYLAVDRTFKKTQKGFTRIVWYAFVSALTTRGSDGCSVPSSGHIVGLHHHTICVVDCVNLAESS